jgi:hypothetical protein
MADTLRAALNLDTVNLVSGGRGEFSVWLGDQLIVKKDYDGFPTEEAAVAAMRRAMADG